MVRALVPGSSGPGSSPGQGTLCCVFRQDTTLTVPLSAQVYKWVRVNCWGNLTNYGVVTCDGLASRPGGVQIPLAACMLQKPVHVQLGTISENARIVDLTC